MIKIYLFSDCAYLSSEACEILQPTAWIPLIDANKINGCMQVHIHVTRKVCVTSIKSFGMRRLFFCKSRWSKIVIH